MTIKYPDLNCSFSPTSNSPANLTGIKTIVQALERLFNTGKGEVPFNREYGSSLKYLLFESNYAVDDIRMYLYQDVTDFEPRVEVSPNDITIEKIDDHTYQVSCSFVVPSLNNTIGNISTTIQDT